MRFRSKARRTKSPNPKIDHTGFSSLGFTLIEMLVVISMIFILLAIALPMYNQSILHAKEARLHQNLTTLNKAIEEFSLDKKKAPQSLDELIPGYIKFVPDDITGGNTWVTDPEEPENQWDPNQPGIGSVHSGSNEVSSSGDPYSSWKH